VPRGNQGGPAIRAQPFWLLVAVDHASAFGAGDQPFHRHPPTVDQRPQHLLNSGTGDIGNDDARWSRLRCQHRIQGRQRRLPQRALLHACCRHVATNRVRARLIERPFDTGIAAIHCKNHCVGFPVSNDIIGFARRLLRRAD
jgi:hypothetical protein